MLQSEKEGPGPGLLEIARSLEPLIRRHEDELERVRRLPDELVDALYDRGVFRAFTPREVGGLAGYVSGVGSTSASP